MSIWQDTYHRNTIKGLPGLDLVTAVNDREDGKRYLVVNLQIAAHGAATNLTATADLTPAQMRELAGALIAQARRIEHDLIPLLHPEPDLIPFRLYHEPEEAMA